jgi:hypothetical protein
VLLVILLLRIETVCQQPSNPLPHGTYRIPQKNRPTSTTKYKLQP